MQPETTLNCTTLSEQVAEAILDGYSENFSVSVKGLLLGDRKTNYQAHQIKISNFYRFEGCTDPQDQSILYLIDTDDGKRGTLVDAYGVYADELISSFMKDVADIHKKKD